MKNFFLSLIIITLFVQIAIAQNNTYKEIGSDEVGSIKIVYKRIFKDSIQNYPLFYHEKTKGEYISLVEAIVEGVSKQGVIAYNARPHDYSEEFEAIMKEEELYNILGGESYKLAEINSFLIKEAWLYDFSDNIIDKRLVGICPVRKYYRDEDTDKDNPLYRKVCWIYYPEIQPILSDKKALEKDGTSNKTLNDILFNSEYNAVSFSDTALYIWGYHKETNTYEPWVNDEINFHEHLFLNENSKLIAEIPSLVYKPIINTPLKHNANSEPIISAKITYKRIYRKDSLNAHNWSYMRWSNGDWQKDSLNTQLFEPKYPEYGYMSFIDLILNGIFTKGITAFKAQPSDAGSEFDVIMTEEEVRLRMGARSSWEFLEGNDSIFIEDPYKSWEIESYLLKEISFYNSAGEFVQSRTIGLCPIRRYYRCEDANEVNPLYRKMFWIYYPELQELAANQNMIKYNITETETFDDFIFNQKYSGLSYIDSSWYYYYVYDKAPEFRQPAMAEKGATNFDNLYANLKDMPQEITPINIENENYEKISGRSFKTAKIVYTNVSMNGNEELFLPPYPNRGFKSFIDVILDAALLSGYRCYKTHNLKEQLTTNEIMTKMGADSEWIYIEGGDSVFIEEPYNSREITNFKLKELWLYDKEGNVVNKRILSICPVRKYYRYNDIDQISPLYSEVFWFSFNEYTKFFKEKYVTQTEVGMPITYNNFFVKDNYKSSINSEEEISKRQAKKILKKIN